MLAPSSIQQHLREARTALASSLSLEANEARLEAQILMQHALGASRAWLIAHEQDGIPDEQRLLFEALLQRRLSGEPIAYILGSREFYGLDFLVTPATLIPRPDTELLVELALERLPQQGRVLDLGTGSGAIALSIAHARPDAEVTALDASEEALEVARGNSRRLNLANVRLLHSDWFSALNTARFDLIVSNPPYVAAGDPHLTQGDLRFEPASALASGPDGLDDIRRIINDAASHLKPGGWLLFEHGYDQAAKVRALLEASGYEAIFSARDLAGIERASGGRLPQN